MQHPVGPGWAISRQVLRETNVVAEYGIRVVYKHFTTWMSVFVFDGF